MSEFRNFKICLLNRFRIERNGSLASRLRYRKHELLIAYVALNRSRSVSVSEVSRTLWPNASPSGSRNLLYQAASRARHTMSESGLVGDDVLQITRERVLLHPAVATDVDEFTEACLRVENSDDDAATKAFSRVKAMYGSGLLPGLEGAWADEVRAETSKLYEHAIGSVTVAAGGGEIVGGGKGADAGSLPASVDMSTYVRSSHERLVGIAEAMTRNFHSIDRERWFRTAGFAIDDVRATIQWAQEAGDHEVALDLAGRYWIYWNHVGKDAEGRRVLEYAHAASHGRGSIPVRARVLEGLAVFASFDGEHRLAGTRIAGALRDWRATNDQLGLGCATFNAALISFGANKIDRANELARQSLDIHRRAGHGSHETKRLIDIAYFDYVSGQYKDAHGRLDEAARRVGTVESWLSTFLRDHRSSVWMGEYYELERESDEARALLERIIRELTAVRDLYQKCGGPKKQSHAARKLGIAYHWLRDFSRAELCYREAETLALDAGDMGSAGDALRELGDLCADQGDVERGIALVRQSVDLLKAAGDRPRLRVSEQALADLLTKGYVARGPDEDLT